VGQATSTSRKRKEKNYEQTARQTTTSSTSKSSRAKEATSSSSAATTKAKRQIVQIRCAVRFGEFLAADFASRCVAETEGNLEKFSRLSKALGRKRCSPKLAACHMYTSRAGFWPARDILTENIYVFRTNSFRF